MKLKLLSLSAALIATVAPMWAHHSFAAEYDSSKPVTMTGAVTKVDWANPHVYFFMDVKDEATGKVNNWAFEMGAPAVLTRSGWRRSSVKVGDVITITGSLAKDSEHHSNARTVVMTATGEKLGAGSSETEGQAPAAQK